MSQFAKLFEAVKTESKTEPIKKNKIPRKIREENLKSQMPKEIRQTIGAEKQIPVGAIKEREPEKVISNKVRQVGKSRNADFTQVLTYIRKNTHREIKKILIDDPHERDLSDLVEELLSNWLKKANNR